MKPPSGNWLAAVSHVCHASFMVVTSGDIWLLIDPLFTDEFTWKGHTERYRDERKVKIDDIRECDGILITHEHEDHFDLASVGDVMGRTHAALFCPEPVAKKAVVGGVRPGRVNVLKKGDPLAIGDIEIVPMPNKGSEADEPCPRFSYLLRTSSRAMLFHSGDSHGPSREWDKHIAYVDIAMLWPSHIEDTIAFLEPRKVVLMHCDKFEPGDFLCNVNASELKRDLEEKFPETQFIVPPKGQWVIVEPDMGESG